MGNGSASAFCNTTIPSTWVGTVLSEGLKALAVLKTAVALALTLAVPTEPTELTTYTQSGPQSE